MRAFFSYFLAVLVALLAFTIIPVERLFDEFMNTQKVSNSIKSADLYGKLSLITAEKMLDQEQFKSMKNSPLMPTQEEVQEILKKTFSKEWFLNNVAAAHEDLIHFISGPTTKDDYFLGIQLTDRKNLLTENITSFMNAKISELPQCTPKEIIRIGMSLTKSGKSSNADISNLNITCRPPAQIQSMMMKVIQLKIDKAVSFLPDSLYWHNNKDPKANNLLSWFKSLYLFSRSFTFIGYGLLLFFLLLIGLLNYNNAPIALYRLAFPFMFSGLLISIPFTWLLTKSDELFVIRSIHLTSGDSFIDPGNSEALQLFVSLIKTLMDRYSWNLIYFAAILFVIGIGLIVVSRLMKMKPLSPLDNRHETNI